MITGLVSTAGTCLLCSLEGGKPRFGPHCHSDIQGEKGTTPLQDLAGRDETLTVSFTHLPSNNTLKCLLVNGAAGRG